MRPETRYAKNGDVHIAYQVTGQGPLDLVFVPGFVSHLEADWDSPEHSRLLERLGSFSGREIGTAGDGVLAAFDGPARAVRCTCAIADGVRPLGIEVRAGLHTGESEVMGDKLGGIAVRIGARVAALAGPGRVLVSSTVKDLVAGAGLQFGDLGAHTLKGVPGEWRLFTVERPEGAAVTA